MTSRPCRPTTRSTAFVVRRCTRPTSLAPSMPTTAMCFSATRVPRRGPRALRTLNPIRSLSFLLRLSKLVRTTLPSRSVNNFDYFVIIADLIVGANGFCGSQTKLTISEGRDGTEFSDGDVLIFPEMIKYR